MASHRSSEMELAAPQLQLASQLQGLHQLHIQLESIVAYLEAREPEKVPIFGEYDLQGGNVASSATGLSTGGSYARPLTSGSEPSTQQAENLVSVLLGQLSEIKRDFGQLQGNFSHNGPDNGAYTNDSYISNATNSAHGWPNATETRQMDYSQMQLCLSDGHSPELSLPRDDSTSVESIDEEEKRSPVTIGKRAEGDQDHVRLLHDFERFNYGAQTRDRNDIASNDQQEHASSGSTMTNSGRSLEQSNNVSADQEYDWENFTPAKCKLLVLQARRQVDARGREVSRLQALVRSLETQLLKSAAPAAVMAQAAVLQKRNTELEEQLRNSRAETAAARSHILALQCAAGKAHETMAAASEPAAAAVADAERLRKRITVLEAQNSKLKSALEEKKAGKSHGEWGSSGDGPSTRNSMGHSTESPETTTRLLAMMNSDQNLSSSASLHQISSGDLSYPPGSNLQTPHFYHLGNNESYITQGGSLGHIGHGHGHGVVVKGQVGHGHQLPHHQHHQHQQQQQPPQDNLALAKWHEGKKLQKRIETLQSKLKEQSDATTTATSAKNSLQAHVTRLTHDLAKSQATVSALRTKLQRREGNGSESNGDKVAGNVPAHAVRALLQELETLQKQYDVLQRQVALEKASISQSKHLAPRSSSAAIVPVHHYNQEISLTSQIQMISSASPNSTNLLRNQYFPDRYSDLMKGDSTEPVGMTNASYDEAIPDSNNNSIQKQRIAADLKILDLELERDQAAARAARLQQRLDLLLNEFADGFFEQGGSNKTGGDKGRKGSKLTTQREQELVDTIALLRAALDKSRKGLESGVSSAKYMQAVEKAKHAAARVKQLETLVEEVEEQKKRAANAQREAADLHVVISALRGQLRDSKRKTKEASAARDEIMNAQVAELERAVRERDAQIAVLRNPACEEARALLAEGLTPKMLVHELMLAR